MWDRKIGDCKRGKSPVAVKDFDPGMVEAFGMIPYGERVIFGLPVQLGAGLPDVTVTSLSLREKFFQGKGRGLYAHGLESCPTAGWKPQHSRLGYGISRVQALAKSVAFAEDGELYGDDPDFDAEYEVRTKATETPKLAARKEKLRLRAEKQRTETRSRYSFYSTPKDVKPLTEEEFRTLLFRNGRESGQARQKLRHERMRWQAAHQAIAHCF